MTTELTTTDASPLVAVLSDPDRLKEFPIETVERLFALDKEHRQEQARRAFADAFSRVQSEMVPVKKRGHNRETRSNFAYVEDVIRMLEPLINANGFSWSVSTTECPTPDYFRFVLTLRHTAGHVETHYMDAPVDDKGPKGGAVKTKLHGMGSSYTYCTRYLLCNTFGVIVTDDDDGVAASTGPAADLITDHQAADIDALIDDVGASREGFMKWLKKVYDVDRIADIRAGWRENVVKTLELQRDKA